MNKRVLALILSLIMVCGLLPTTGAASSSDSAAVFVTVSVAGEIPTGKNEAPMAQVPVTVTDHNNSGELDIDDALYALHDAYYYGGAEAGYASEDSAHGLSLTKLWGDTSRGFLYYVNNVSPMSLADSVKSGDYLNVYVLKDQITWSDSYAKFDAFTKTATVGESISLTLENAGYEESTLVWSNLEGAVLYDLADDSIVLATTDASGKATLSFPAAGTYYITASHEDTTLVPPVCAITVTEERYASVRIEGNGFGTDGDNANIGTVLPYTLVNLDALPEGYKAIDVVNAALEASGKTPAEGADGFYSTFGGVTGQAGEFWCVMLGDEAVSIGLNELSIAPGDNLVLMLTGYDPLTYYNTTDYAYFRIVSSRSDLQFGCPYGEVTLALKSKAQNGYSEADWIVTPVTNTAIDCNGSQAWTPKNDLAVTDGENGVATITLWGDADAGTYYFDISAALEGATPAYCRATMVYDGEHPPKLSFSAPSAKDTTLSKLTLTFPGAAASDGLPYVGASPLRVGNNVASVTLDAKAREDGATIAATYQAADADEASVYTPGASVNLAEGDNRFRITVTNDGDSQVHTLVIARTAAESRDIPAEVAGLITGLKTVTGDAPYTDWILAMHAAGLSPTQAQLETYLAAVLSTVDNFADHGTGNPAAMAKIAIALTALGIDARQIPDPDGGEAIDLVRAVSAHDMTTNPVYGAPYLLALYDLGNYAVPAEAANGREALIDAILNKEDDWALGGVDGIGMVLPALAPYYKAEAAVNGIPLTKCQAVTAAVDRALAVLSAAQTVDGGFGDPNSNTASTILLGLSAIGINAHTNEDYIKGGTSVLMNLLSFRTVDNKLGFADANSPNTLACIQGFQALAVWQNLATERSSNLYHFTREIAPYTNWPDAKLLTSIAVTTLPANLVYSLGIADTAVDTQGMVVTATYNGDAQNTQVIDIGDCEISPIDCSTAGTKTVTVSYQGKTATFLVTVRNTDGSIPKQQTVSVAVQNGSTIIARDRAVVIEEGVTTALDVLKTALNAAGKTYVIRNGIYVSEIEGKGEFDKGANSGWLYSVNGVTPPTTSAHEYALSDGDVVLWYYTLDYTKDPSSAPWTGGTKGDLVLTPKVTAKDGAAAVSVSASDMNKAIGEAKDSETGLITIAPEISGKAAKISVEIPKKSVSDMASGTQADLKIVTPIGTVTIPSGALSSVGAQAEGSTIAVVIEAVEPGTLTAEQQRSVGINPVFDLAILSGGKAIGRFDGESITIALPYTLKSGESAGGVTVWYLDGSGKLTPMACTYDKDTGFAAFSTRHLSHYVVGYDSWTNPFTDVKAEDWFYTAVKYAAQSQLFTGTSDTAFAPGAEMTRAMLVTVLYRLEGKPAVAGASTFADVKSGEWYTDAVLWASSNGIVGGYGNGAFGTGDPVTREQMAAILHRYAGYKKVDTAGAGDLSAYADAGAIAPFALAAMKWANAKGFITGRSADTLEPAGTATRAEVATILLRFIESTAK